MKKILTFCFFLLFPFAVFGQPPYKLPPREVVEILDAAPTPFVVPSPLRDAMLLVHYKPHPSIAFVSQPIIRIGGLRINPELGARQRLTQYMGITVRWFESNKTVKISIPTNSDIGFPVWSNDGKKIAFTRDMVDRVELWVADVSTGKSKALKGIRVMDILDSPFEWMKDNSRLLVHLVPEGRGKSPEPPKVPAGPIIDETAGKVSRMATFQDLLKNSYDEKLFEHNATSQLAIVNSSDGSVAKLGKSGLYSSASFSPDEKYLLLTKLRRPFSYRVPYFYFTRSVEVWNAKGSMVKTIADLPISDEIPQQGVPLGPRFVHWQPLKNGRLVWVEALDGGDPVKKVPHRDRAMILDAPFEGQAEELLKIQHRFSGFDWTQAENLVLYAEYDRDRRWRTTHALNLANADRAKKVFDLSVNDSYKDPGRPVYGLTANGERVVLQDGDWIYFSGRGATEQGDRPFLDRLNLETLQSERLFQCGESSVEQFTTFIKDSRTSIVTRYESKTEAPNYFVVDVQSNKKVPLTDFKDPAPRLAGMRKQLVKYKRADGVDLSGTLYLPPDYREGTRLPCLLWAYPLEYSDPGTAGQVRGSPHAFTFLRGASPIFFVTQGYAVLMDATMPVIGDPETMNNTFVEQIVSSAKAAIDKLDEMGVIDRNRVAVAGHSYGAFMTANLLAHSDLFAAGIARSGAYNRSLTPFGFQSERRTFWEATDTYMKVSPFTFAHKINEPILLIHGEADNNSGTYPIQSQRLFEAIKGNGGTARLVFLPFESHGYAARESNLHVLAEMLEWAEKYVKNKVQMGAK
ncbi:MAG: prolyl oligopeptidase family serine peptidase [Ignavibacteriales bacterium]|nr:prolyl oligopeptidase family serine peptidase [Ignavibacteriales bacterium]